MALLSIRNLHKQYGNVTAIQSLDLDLEKGEVIVLLGPSGCGKSTLLRCVNGLEPYQGGCICSGRWWTAGRGTTCTASTRK